MSSLDAAFVLPALTDVPFGGFLMTYEYAVRLAERGHKVKVLHLHRPAPLAGAARRIRLRRLLEFALHPSRLVKRIGQSVTPTGGPRKVAPSWYPLPPSVESWLAPLDALPGLVTTETAVVATAHDTAAIVNALPHGRKYYLVRDWETWEGADEGEMVRSLWLPMHIIVTSQFLHGLVNIFRNVPVSVVPEPIDHTLFNVRVPPAERDPLSVLFYYNRGPRKDWTTALAVLHAVLQRPGVHATVYGSTRPPGTLPSSVEFVIRPPREEQPKLYNRHALFVHTSYMEGWGLPPMEALACGCACVMTDSLGVRDYLDPAQRQRIRRPGDVDGLVVQLSEWMDHPAARVAAAEEGVAAVRPFTWPRSLALMEEALSS